MFNRRCTTKFGLVSLVAARPWAVPSATALAQCGGHGGMGGHSHAAARDDSHGSHSEHQYHVPNGGLSPPVQRTPHGGLILETGTHRLEVVYLPRETRVYLYGKSREPLSTLALRGQMSPQVRGESSPRPVSLQHVPPSGLKEQDYLATAIDLSQLADETPITFRFDNLPDRRYAKATFTPIFSLSQIRPYVARVSFVQADREGIALQQTCPVTGARLGSMGSPLKVLVGDRPLYLCCASCIEKVKETSENPSAQPPVVSTTATRLLPGVVVVFSARPKRL